MPEVPTNQIFMSQQTIGNRSGAGEPVTANPTVPDYIGQLYFDTTGADFYIATSLAAAGWKKNNA